VLGANFGGLMTALELDRRLGDNRDVSILVVDRDNVQLFTPLLWLVANGRVNLTDVLVPIRTFQRGRSFHLLHADVESIDLDKREVMTTSGSRPYDILVIALGSITVMPDLPGLHEYARLFHTTAHALQLRNYLIDAVEDAHQSEDPAARRAYLTFVVAGGGDTGIELAATINDYIVNGLFAEYPWLADEKVRIVIVGRAERLLPMSSPHTSENVRRVLESEGIEVLTGASVTGVTAGSVQTSVKEIPSHTLFWAAGITAPDPVRDLPVDHARNGAVNVDDHLRVPGRPEVYVVGDAAWAFDSASGAPVPPTAQAAEHEAAYVAGAIAAELKGQPAPAFRFTPLGHLALLGNHTGVAEIGPFVFKGLPAWLMWHAYYLWHIPSWENRLYLALHLLLSALLGRDTRQVRLDGEQSATGSPRIGGC
jgi:NADH:ubiquinone reductase (H+-translocating)